MMIKTRVIQYDKVHDYELEISFDGGKHWISVALDKEQFAQLQLQVLTPEQIPSYGN